MTTKGDPVIEGYVSCVERRYHFKDDASCVEVKPKNASDEICEVRLT